MQTKGWKVIFFVAVCCLLAVLSVQAQEEGEAGTLSMAILEVDGNTLTLVGTGPPNGIVAVVANTHKIRLISADNNGEWTTDITLFEDGAYQLRARLIDPETGDTTAITGITPFVLGGNESAELVDLDPCENHSQAGTFLANNRYRIGICETLSQVSNRFGITLSELLDVNSQIENAAFVLVGQTINLPDLSPYNFEVTAVRSTNNSQHITLLLRYELNDRLIEGASVSFLLPDNGRVTLDSSLPRPTTEGEGALAWRLQPSTTSRGTIALELDIVDGEAAQLFSAELLLTVRDQDIPVIITQSSQLTGQTATRTTPSAPSPAATGSSQPTGSQVITMTATPAPISQLIERPEPFTFETIDQFGWSRPVNLSRSGAAFQPKLITDNDQMLHLFWHDVFAGIVYARQIDDTTWTEPIALGRHFSNQLFVPSFDTDDNLHVLWEDENRELKYSRVEKESIGNPNVWRSPELIAEWMDGVSMVTDEMGRQHLVYIGMIDYVLQEAAILYRVWEPSGEWSPPTIIEESSYLRVLIGTAAHTDIAVMGEQIFVAWDVGNRGQIRYARSDDSGTTWSPSVLLDQHLEADGENAENPGGVALAQSAESVYAVWYAGHGDLRCALYQQNISDAGTQTSGAALSDDLISCPESIAVTSIEPDQLAFLATNDSYTFLTTYKDGTWSEPRVQPILTAFTDSDSAREVSLSCLTAVNAQDALWLSGCDRNNGADVWLSRHITPDESLIVATQVVATAETTVVFPTPDATLVPTLTPIPTLQPTEATTPTRNVGNMIFVTMLVIAGVGISGYGVYSLMKE